MILFSRMRAAKPERFLEAVPQAVEIGQYVAQVTGIQVTCWTAVYGLPVGTISWTTIVDSQAALGEVQEKLAVDPGYLERAQRNTDVFEGPLEDTVTELVAVAGDDPTAGDNQYVNFISAQCAPGRIVDAMGWGVEILNQAAGITGLTGAMVRGLYGPWATLGWYSLAPDLAAVDAATAALSADETYLQTVDSGSALFREGTAQSALFRRLG